MDNTVFPECQLNLQRPVLAAFTNAQKTNNEGDMAKIEIFNYISPLLVD